MNGWIPAVSVNAQCNNDGKILTNGVDTKNITFYVSSYAGKKQGKNFNMSAVLADGYAYHEKHPKPEYLSNLREQQRLMLFRLVNAINREQELAGPHGCLVPDGMDGHEDVPHVLAPVLEWFCGAYAWCVSGAAQAGRVSSGRQSWDRALQRSNLVIFLQHRRHSPGYADGGSGSG